MFVVIFLTKKREPYEMYIRDRDSYRLRISLYHGSSKFKILRNDAAKMQTPHTKCVQSWVSLLAGITNGQLQWRRWRLTPFWEIQLIGKHAQLPRFFIGKTGFYVRFWIVISKMAQHKQKNFMLACNFIEDVESRLKSSSTQKWPILKSM